MLRDEAEYCEEIKDNLEYCVKGEALALTNALELPERENWLWVKEQCGNVKQLVDELIGYVGQINTKE